MWLKVVIYGKRWLYMAKSGVVWLKVVLCG